MSDTPALMDQLVDWRRHLHQYPEASFEEVETVAYIREELSKHAPKAQLENLTPTSLVAVLDTGRPGPKIGLRADIDGLVMTEDRPDLEFASKVENRMHGCGHDGHTATIMAAITWANEHLDELEGTIVGIFQHAEETPPGGAQEMVATGYFNDFDYIYGFHYWSTLPTGTVDIKNGAASANSDLWEITAHGVGAHASTPEDSVDAVGAVNQFIQQTMTIPARRVSGLRPAVVSTTWLQAGSQSALNVFPPKAQAGGVVRTQDAETRETAIKSLQDFAASLEVSHPGLKVELDYLRGYDMVWNDPERTDILREIVQERYPELEIIADEPMLGGEDFAAFAQVAPASYLFIGAGNPEKGFDAGHHNPRFGLDEDAFPIAFNIAVDVIRNATTLTAGSGQ